MTIHVAAGTYYPDESTAGGDTNNRDATFPLINNLAIYGGYPSGGGTRDWKANVTILSGDIDQNDATSDTSGNSLHVVNSWNATLDGFTISGGNADGGGGCPADCGGGLYQYDGGLALSNAIFRANSAAKGGGMYFHDNTESVTLDNLLFEGNSATDGGGVYFSLFSGTLNNITFANNSATNGGAMYNYSYGATIYNSIFWGNSATSGAEVYNDNMTAMLSLDSVLLQGGCGGIVESGIATACNNILTIDPQFVNDAPGGDYRLQNCSPAIDAGDNTIVTAATDLGGNSRIVGGTVDMGAYENTVGACFIGDRVWNDSDGDGVQDAGESGLSGVTLELRNDLCNPGVDCPTTVSGADGTYAFSGIGAGSYIVAVTGGVPTGHVPSYDEDGGNDAQTSVTISTGHPAHATADFGYDLATFTLTLTQAGTGSGSMTSLPSGISCSTTCSATFDYGQSVTLTANAEPGSSFVSWSGDCIGSGDCELLGVTSDKNVGALFTLNTYAFSTAISGSGSVSGSTADGTYDHGTAITLVATPSADSIFAGWSPPTCVDGFNLLADTECTATFEPGAVAPADPQPIPTLSDWMRLLLIALIGGLVWGWRVRNTGG
jgi:predicted outer membrane repeat protein